MTIPVPTDALDLAEIDPDDWQALGDRMDGNYPVPILTEPVGGPAANKPAASAKKPAMNPRMPGRDGLPDPDATDVAREIVQPDLSDLDIADRLIPYNSRQLRAIAARLQIPIPARVDASVLRVEIARAIVRDRGRSTVRSADPATRHRELQLLGVETRAAGQDVTPGHDELHHYWTRGEGLAKWRTHPHPWTTLYHHLLKYVNPEMAKRMASKWFIEVFGYAAGSDLHRVDSGKPPRGHLVGPG